MIIAYGIPAYRSTVHAGHVMQTAQLSSWSTKLGIKALYTWVDSSFLPAARNRLLWWAIQNKADWLLMSDSDTFCAQGDAVLRMIDEANRRGAAVVAAPVQLRNRTGFNCENVRGGVELQLEKEDFEGRLLPVDRIGTGFMAINCRWVYENLPYPWPEKPWFYMDQYSEAFEKPPSWSGEDYGFCDQVRAKGGEVLADGRLEPSHVGSAAEIQAMAIPGLAVEGL